MSDVFDLTRDSSGGKAPSPRPDKPRDECESADPKQKEPMAPPEFTNLGGASDFAAAAAGEDTLVTITTTPPLASAEHVSCSSFLFNVGCA